MFFLCQALGERFADSFAPHNNPMRSMMLSSFFTDEAIETERLINLSKVPQLEYGKSGFELRQTSAASVLLSGSLSYGFSGPSSSPA